MVAVEGVHFKEAGDTCFLCKGKALRSLHDRNNHAYTNCPICGEFIITALAASILDNASPMLLRTYAAQIKYVPPSKILWIMRPPPDADFRVALNGVLRIEGDGSPRQG